MKKKSAKCLCALMACLLLLPFCALAGDGLWRVNVSHDLRGGSWPDGMVISPYQLKANVGNSMAKDSLDAEKLIKPFMAESVFLGWSVLFTAPQNGRVIYDSGTEIWNLNHPFDYYPDNPRLMNCLMTARWRAADKPSSDVWIVHVMHNLQGGSWPDGMVISPYTLTANAGQPMANDSLDAEKLIKPYMAESYFMGWSVLFTDANNGNIIYDGRGHIWDLNHPFDYYPDNPRSMNCLMIANWQSSQSDWGSSLPREKLPDGRVITWPFPAGTDPLPEIPPAADEIISGTSWFTGALICGIEEGMKVPVFSFPVFNGPVMDWVGLDDRMDYGLYLGNGWVMLYNPKWAEASGIGFIDHEVVAFPGVEE
jgi:hypothetical protein